MRIVRGNAQDVDVLLVGWNLRPFQGNRDTASKRVAHLVAGRKQCVPVVAFEPADLDAMNERVRMSGPIPVSFARLLFTPLTVRSRRRSHHSEPTPTAPSSIAWRTSARPSTSRDSVAQESMLMKPGATARP